MSSMIVTKLDKYRIEFASSRSKGKMGVRISVGGNRKGTTLKLATSLAREALLEAKKLSQEFCDEPDDKEVVREDETTD